jgi:hypothetical protein
MSRLVEVVERGLAGGATAGSYERRGAITTRVGANLSDMERHPCPVCKTDVQPLPVASSVFGEIIGPTADGLLIERTRCPDCGASLERTTLHEWHVGWSDAVAQSARAAA